jgi:CRP/FNR family transcriptional regulator, polysaccharide utilization system transcription regulator
MNRIIKMNERKKSIVLIEDNEEMRENIAEILELANYDVIPAESGKRGLDLIKEKHPDLIICDEMMPEMTGYSLLKKFKSIGKKNHTPFLFLTAGTDKYQKQKSYNPGSSDYLMKPFNVEELLMIVKRKLNGAMPYA